VTPELDLVAASLLSLGADARAARLYKALGPAARLADLAAALGVPAPDIPRECGIARARAAVAVERGLAAGLTVTSVLSPHYPVWLAHIIDPPIVLWGKGDLSVLNRPSVAVVGSRRPSSTSLSFAERLAAGLARSGLVVTSGLALGVDGAAHRGALGASGQTVAVLGTGLDIIYPKQHGQLANDVQSNGCLVSEFPPGIGPEPFHFPLRNRVISGLARAVVVVEATEKSGSLITARMALEQGRGVCAVPGSVVSGCHKGCHALIKDGARLVETVDDVLDEIGWTARESAESVGRKAFAASSLVDMMVPGDPVTVDGLAARCPDRSGGILAELTTLELDGRVQRLPGGWFVRVD
jgi:DNA processing protein